MSGETVAGFGTIVIVNKEGWFLTAKHLFNELEEFHRQKNDAERYYGDRKSIEQNNSIDAKQRRRLIGKLKSDPNWVTATAFEWYPGDGLGSRPFGAKTFVMFPEHDLALGKLDSFDEAWVPNYPEFPGVGGTMSQGMSLCRLGFAFPNATASYSANTGTLTLNVAGLSSFPNDSIFTRYIDRPPDAIGRAVRFVETSTPGIKGQSGGPIFDRDGVVWAIQSSTNHLSLDFDPPHPKNDKKTFHQFLNVGLGVAPETIALAMRENGVAFATK